MVPLLGADYYPAENLAADPFREYLFTYDEADNRLSQVIKVNGTTQTNNSWTYDDDNSLDGYTYDNTGRLTNDGYDPITWDAADRPVSKGGTGDGQTTHYNGLGQRIGFISHFAFGSAQTNLTLDVQPGLHRTIKSAQGSNIKRYVFDPQGIQRQQLSSGSWQHLLTDGLGTVRTVADGSLNPVHTQHFAPYGTTFGSVGSIQTIFHYTGEPVDRNGLYLRARYYMSQLGVFPSLDPIEGGLNRYGYVAANPANFVDPSGLFGEMPSKGGSCFLQDDKESICHTYDTLSDFGKSQCKSLWDVHNVRLLQQGNAKWFDWQVGITYESVLKQAGKLAALSGRNHPTAFKTLFEAGWSLFMTELSSGSASAQYYPPGYSQLGLPATEQSRHRVIFYRQESNGPVPKWEHSYSLDAAEVAILSSSSEGEVYLFYDTDLKENRLGVAAFSQSLIAHEMGHGFVHAIGHPNNVRFVDWSPVYKTISCGVDCTSDDWLKIGQMLPWFNFGQPAARDPNLPTHRGRNWSKQPNNINQTAEFGAEIYALWTLGYLDNPTQGINEFNTTLSNPFVKEVKDAIECELSSYFGIQDIATCLDNRNGS